MMMNYGICTQAAAPLRLAAQHDSEMVSQLLYNDVFQIIEAPRESNWAKIVTEYDQYEGWIHRLQFRSIELNEYEKAINCPKHYINKATSKYGERILSFGTTLFEPTTDTVESPIKFNQSLMAEYAQQLLGAPYLWGGKNLFGIDCSGLVQLCAKVAGLRLPRNASQQALLGDIVYFLQESQSGDLAFFGDDNNHITHVGIVLPEQKIIHASGCVKIDFLDQTGIFNKESGRHTHALKVIKRLG